MLRTSQYSTLFFVLLVFGCSRPDSSDQNEAASDTPDAATNEIASDVVAVLRPTAGNNASGIVAFFGREDGVLVRAEISDATPGKHGFHVHENGDCSAPDASSAGGHFAIDGTPHGAPDAMEGNRHVGDLGNLVVGQDGTGKYDRMDLILALDGQNSIRGKAVVLHGGEDDLLSQPSGAAGPRIACGVIQ
ncbi:MAG: superoxide dismutase family protein [Rhodothermales bacterium]|nr:superoxide dismutase family protein [Rhodothermales bacterium]